MSEQEIQLERALCGCEIQLIWDNPEGDWLELESLNILGPCDQHRTQPAPGEQGGGEVLWEAISDLNEKTQEYWQAWMKVDARLTALEAQASHGHGDGGGEGVGQAF